jgi:hypothetical protein
VVIQAESFRTQAGDTAIETRWQRVLLSTAQKMGKLWVGGFPSIFCATKTTLGNSQGGLSFPGMWPARLKMLSGTILVFKRRLRPPLSFEEQGLIADTLSPCLLGAPCGCECAHVGSTCLMTIRYVFSENHGWRAIPLLLHSVPSGKKSV